MGAVSGKMRVCHLDGAMRYCRSHMVQRRMLAVSPSSGDGGKKSVMLYRLTSNKHYAYQVETITYQPGESDWLPMSSSVMDNWVETNGKSIHSVCVGSEVMCTLLLCLNN